ncbi:MAG: SDR family NAD(P)-dependent oxidoreductase [Minisyncoccia bacterium]
MNIKDKVAVITGASKGIGLATAKELAKRGAKVVLAARSTAVLKKLSAEIPDSLAIATDVCKPKDIRNLVRKTLKTYGRIDIFINNAGQGLRSPVESIDLENYKAIMELNVFAVVRTMEEVIPIMRKQGGGMIINVSSMVSKNYYPGLAAYASTKYALNALSFTARVELAKDDIVVSVFHPKMTATDFGANSLGEKYDSSSGRPGMEVDTAEEVAEKIADLIESEEPEAQM